MNILSIILYSDVATAAMIAGPEYCHNRRPIGLVPNTVGDVWALLDVSAIIF
jgi:hypothetical protein